MAKTQRYLITVRGREHVLSRTEKGFQQILVHTVDGAEVARRTTSDQRVTLKPSDPAEGVLKVRLTVLGAVRRATLVLDDLEVDLDPEPGSRAALLEARARERPRLYAARHVVGAAAGVLLPLLGIGLLINVVLRWLGGLLPDVDGPDLPSVPTPDLPDIPWPDWELPDWQLPGWVQALAAAAKFVVPILIALGVAAHEVRRRRQQDELKQQLHDGTVESKSGDRRTDSS
ncbi:hypothetical protein [Luteipulveratus halotolerans]|nr:hypothetical protein [Luteipulveratus halotolerans]